jgi:hypothetical protein
MINGAIEMVKLGPGLAIPVDRLPLPLRRRWDEAMARRGNGENVARLVEAVVRDVRATLGPELLFRAAHQASRRSIMDLGLADRDAGPLDAARS